MSSNLGAVFTMITFFLTVREFPEVRLEEEEESGGGDGLRVEEALKMGRRRQERCHGGYF